MPPFKKERKEKKRKRRGLGAGWVRKAQGKVGRSPSVPPAPRHREFNGVRRGWGGGGSPRCRLPGEAEKLLLGRPRGFPQRAEPCLAPGAPPQPEASTLGPVGTGLPAEMEEEGGLGRRI